MFAVTVTNAIATLVLSRPPVNAISEEWIAGFDTELDRLALRSDWHVLVLRSDQKIFCSGADLKEISDRSGNAGGSDRMYSFVASIQRLYARIEQLRQVTIAEIGGAAMGGGFELALSCDLRIAASEAKLGLPEVRLGLIPGAGGTQRLTRLCGRSIAARLILGAEILDGAAACELGLVHWAVPRAELMQRTHEIASRIALLPPDALAASKVCIAAAGEPGRGGYVEELEATRRLLTSPETRKRVEAFLAGARA